MMLMVTRYTLVFTPRRKPVQVDAWLLYDDGCVVRVVG
jgi:hypothetical protein